MLTENQINAIKAASSALRQALLICETTSVASDINTAALEEAIVDLFTEFDDIGLPCVPATILGDLYGEENIEGLGEEEIEGL